MVLERALRDAVPALASLLVRADQDLVGLNVRVRSEGDVIVVVKRLGPDGGPQVCFGSGYDVCGALVSANGAIHANRWQEDIPWTPER